MLEKINSPKDLKLLSDEEITLLIPEIREFLIENSEKHGGHLASNLGIVELTVAIHRIFDSPKDKIIFDVGHQSYVHKLLTGRRDAFEHLRLPGGLSGFTSRRESEHDPFGAGHSSTSVSAALGFSVADRIRGREGHTVAVIGDGAYTGGMVHEALNNLTPDLPLIIILNENGMSISSNKGTFARYLSRVRASQGYIRWKSGTNNAVLKIPKIGKTLKKAMTAVKERIKKLIFSKNYFEELGLYYIGPIDGNNYKEVYRALEQAKRIGKTVVLHVKTVKGKGYPPAEQSPDGYHSVSGNANKQTFSKEFARCLTKLAAEDDRIVAITAAMGIGTGLSEFERTFPERCFDVGIAEEHAVTFSAALAAAGMKPFAAIYSTFLQRGYDNLIHDVALQNIPAVFMIDRAGLAVADGATHHGIFDVAYLSHMPNMQIFAPMSFASLLKMIRFSLISDSPVAIRYSNSSEPSELLERLHYIDDWILADFGIAAVPKRLFVTYGRISANVMDARDILVGRGESVGVIVLERLKPYGIIVEKIISILSGTDAVLFVEEGIKYGGAGEILISELMENGLDMTKTALAIAAIDDNFAIPDAPTDIYDYVELSKEKLAEKIIKL